MKVRIYKAPDGKGKLVKAKDGMAVNTDKEIKRKIAEGKDPEIIIYEMAEFGLSRPEARDRVYKLYDLLGDDDYDEDEVVAPYDEPVEEEVAEVVEEEEPDNAAIYDYYGGDNQGLAVVNDGADDEDEDEDEEARYGGQYAEGGQFAPGSIIPEPKKPYYIGMDAEPYDNAYKFGGLTKGAYVKKRIKELRKAAQGDEVQNNETNISARGTIDSPSGFTSPEKNLASIIKQNANEAMLKQQAENEYQQYQNSTMGQDFNGKFLFGGRNRKIRRANRAMFGTPFAFPGVDVNYEFGPLGGLRKAEANWDLDAIGDLAKLLPGAMNMMPGMFPGMMPGMMSYKKVSYPAQVRKKSINTINNAALDEVAKQNPNSTAAQNNRTDKKNELKCPPGAVYDPSLGHCIDQEGNRVRSIIDLPDPEELLGNPFENPNARMLNGKKTMKATGPAASASSNAAAMTTQAPSAGGAPLQNESASSSISPVVSPITPVAPATPEWKGVYDPATDSYIDDSSMLYEFMTNNPDIVNDPTMEKTYNEMGYSSEDWNKAKSKYLSQKQQVGGFVDAANMDPNTLAKFIYGGDEYAYGGDVLPKAYDGYITNFQRQMEATKNRINQMGNKKPEDLLGNPFRGNAFGKATTGIQPSGTIGNRFQPSGQPNAGTTTQGGTGTTTNTNQTKTTTTTNQGQPQFDANTMAQFQKYMQMMQGQQGMGQGQFWTGRPQRLGFGFTRDFNYGTSYSPVNWQVPEGTKGVKQTAYKDRGKWWNPFDTKRITEWRIDNGEAPAAPGATTTTGDGSKTGTEGSTGTGVNSKGEPGTTERGWGEGELTGWKNKLRAKRHDKWMDEIDNQKAIDKQMDEDAANEAIEDDSKAPTRGASQIPTSVSGPAPETIQTQGESAVSASNPFAGNAFSGNQFGSATTGIQPSGDLKSAQSPNDFTMTGQSNVSSNPFTGNAFSGNAFGNANMGVSGNVSNSPSATPGANNMTSNTNVAGSEGAQENTQDDLSSEMQNFGTPGFGEDMEGAPNIGGMSPWALSSGFGTNDQTQNTGSQMTESGIPYAEDLPFSPTDINDPAAGFGYGISNKMPSAVNNKTGNTTSGNTNFQSSSNQQQGNAAYKNQQQSNAKGFGMSQRGVKDIASRVTDKNDLGNRGLMAAGNVYKMWENEPNKKQYGSFENWAKQKGYSNLVNREGGEIDYMAYGGYIPEYMAYGGYIPMAKSGITAGKPEFEDPNLIGRMVENSAYTFRGPEFVAGSIGTARGLTNILRDISDKKNIINPQMVEGRTSDAATANTGQSGFGSAGRKGYDLMASGNETQYGSTPGRQGDEGGLYGKKGGSMNTQYAKGKVYSLTIDQIKAIEAAGGKVEYIK